MEVLRLEEKKWSLSLIYKGGKKGTFLRIFNHEIASSRKQMLMMNTTTRVNLDMAKVS